MADSINITPEILQHIGTHSAELMLMAYQAMDVWDDVTVLPDVKNETTLTSLHIDKIVKPYSGTFSPSEDAITFKPNTVGVKVGKADLLIEPEKYRQTYLAQFSAKGVNRSPEDLPFAQYVLEAIFAEFGEELNDDTAWNGVYNPNGNKAVDVADGYGTILNSYINDGFVTPEGIGEFTKDDAGEQQKVLYRSIPDKWKKAKNKLTMYLSRSSYDAIVDYEEKQGYWNGRGTDMLGPKYMRGTDQLVEYKVATWMASTKRVFITLKDNILLPADATTRDLAKMNVIPDVWTVKMGIAAALGFNFRYKGLIWCNEVD